MKIVHLEDLPNIGKCIAKDLRAIGIMQPTDLQGKNPMDTFNRLQNTMGLRHDPCVLYTLLSIEHFFKTSEKIPWWKFTDQGKTQLRNEK